MNTVPLHHQDTRTPGPPLVILHGLFGCLDNWHTLARRWGPTRRVITVDLRNHGRSPHHPEFGYRDMAADVVRLLDDLQLETVDLLGHSMGGKAAMTLALTHPRRLHRLVVVDIAPRPYGPGLLPIFDALASVDFEGVTSREEVERQLAPNIPNPGVRLFLMKNLTRTDNGGLRWKMNLPVIRAAYEDINDDLPVDGAFPGPTLAVRGTRSDYVTDNDLQVFRELFPDLHVQDIDCGHWVHAEAPERFFETVEGFLEMS